MATEPIAAPVVERSWGHLIGGEWTVPGPALAAVDPANGAQIAEIADGDAADVEAAVAAAAAAFPRWRRSSPAARAALLHELADRVQAHAPTLAALEAWDAGKPVRQATTWDLPLCAEVLRYYAAVARTSGGEVSEPNAGTLQIVRRRPAGPVGQIIPWNATVLMVAMKVAPALAAGCTVVLKPSELASLPALELLRVWADALPPGTVNLVTGGPEVGRAIVSAPELRRISFTGSPAVGRQVMAAAAERLTPVMLELGGKSPSIVFPDADLDAAVEGTLVGIIPNQGQMCAAGTRLLLHERIADEFLAKLGERIAGLRIGPPLDPTSDLGPLVSAGQREKVLARIEEATAAGAREVFRLDPPDGLPEGGNWCPVVGFEATPEMKVAREEVFGPVLSVLRWEDEKALPELANDVATGLAAAVWCADAGRALALLDRVDAGVAWVNTYGFLPPGAPFGGVKDSGFGRENGAAALDEYRDLQTVLVRHSGPGVQLY
ncbi:MAG TPA: aldehyde dehydrogenase family protein [Solirubrobacterales bacterium]|nr:aldehyde dehydrogenase family protein [Solirubrobacterales bacterium]